MTDKPAVSVCISSYNHAKYIGECLESILAQTYQNFEIVIIDDGSQDDSHELLLDYQRRHPEKICYSWHPGHANLGISITSNRVIEKSSGKYIAWIGSDDLWRADKLEKQVAALEGDAKAGLVYCLADYIDEDGNRLGQTAGVDITRGDDPVTPMILYCQTPAMTVMVRRECLEEAGLFNEELVYSDWDLMLRILARWDARFIGEPLALYRKHRSNTSMGINPYVDLERVLAAMRMVRGKAQAVGGRLVRPRNLALLDLQIAFLLYYADDKDGAAASLRRAFEDDPLLRNDVGFFLDWLRSWKPDYRQLDHCHFGLWTLSMLPPDAGEEFRAALFDGLLKDDETLAFYARRAFRAGQAQPGRVDLSRIFDDVPAGLKLSDEWKGRVLKSVYPALLFESYGKRKYPAAWQYWSKTLRSNPKMFWNRGVWAIGVQSFVQMMIGKVG